MTRTLHRLAICFTLSIVAGCAQVLNRPHEAPPPVATPMFIGEKNSADDFVGYARSFGELSAEGQRREYALTMQALSRNKQDTAARMKAALIAALPASRYRDNSRALGLLAELQHDKDVENGLRALTTVLKDYVAERQKLEDNAARLAQKARDEQKRADELQQKLDELKNIEKTLIERGQGPKK